MSEEEVLTYTLMSTLTLLDYCSEWQKIKKKKVKKKKARGSSKQVSNCSTWIFFPPLENLMEMAKRTEGRRNLHWTLGRLMAMIHVGNHRLSAKCGSREGLIGFMAPFMLKTSLSGRWEEETSSEFSDTPSFWGMPAGGKGGLQAVGELAGSCKEKPIRYPVPA